MLHYIALHFITMYHITLQNFTLLCKGVNASQESPYIVLFYIMIYYITLHYNKLHYITMYHILHYIVVSRGHCIGVPLHYIILHHITLYYITLHHTALYCITSLYKVKGSLHRGPLRRRLRSQESPSPHLSCTVHQRCTSLEMHSALH